ncbi:MAG TPA: 6-pyruvoyl tetrahydropterin synthase family protein [Solidesulfovibrio magneticus]|nr:6-pyruvoyl tetrahydropterin synthase family protein [Solidesulfovibrio magneticus]
MHRVTIEQGNLRFSAAHFISFAGKCERLHGHNYAVSVTLAGDLTDDRYVFDFVELKRLVKSLCDRLDHRFLLPRQSPCLAVTEADGEVEVRFKNRRYVFPRHDVLDLPLDNITAERLAEYLAGELAAALAPNPNLSHIEVGVEEAPGQTAYFRLTLAGGN